MHKYSISTIILAIAIYIPVFATTSPNGKISLEENNGIGMNIYYSSRGSDIRLLSIACDCDGRIGKPIHKTVEYEMVTGKKLHCLNEYVEQSFMLSAGDTLTIRLYNDGIAWKRPGKSVITIVDPKHIWLQKWKDCYENLYIKDPDMDAERYGYPALIEYRDNIFALLTESGMTPDDAGSSMYYKPGTKHETADLTFEIIPDGQENGGWQTMIAGTLSDVVESTLVTDNSPAAVLTDTSWIEPGVASWIYWAYNHGSNDYDIICRYVDFASELKLPYVLIDAEWDEMKNGKTIEDALEYCKSKGVKPLIWYNSSIGWVDGAPGPKFRLNTPEDLEKEFSWCEKMGISGVKIDFFSGDTNQNMKFMTELLEAAARHHLTVNFHGAPLPRGWQRTYPNYMTTEAVYGAEWYNNVPTFTEKASGHNATLPFTRNVVGSMDYTPCAFTDSQHPHITTDGHELALTALFESGIQHLADRPESFMSQPDEVKGYLSELPAAWDQTLLLGGYPGEYVIMARRNGGKWWISAINGTDKPLENIKIDYSRTGISPHNVKGIIFEDSPSGKGKKWRITPLTDLPATISLLPRGGAVMVVENN